MKEKDPLGNEHMRPLIGIKSTQIKFKDVGPQARGVGGDAISVL